MRSAAAGAMAATVWALQEPIDQRLLRCDYSDVAVLGKAVTRGRSWRAAGLAIHALNGALFGLAFHEGRTAFGVSVAISKSSAETVMPIFVNTRVDDAPDLYATLFVDIGL